MLVYTERDISVHFGNWHHKDIEQWHWKFQQISHYKRLKNSHPFTTYFLKFKYMLNNYEKK